MKNPANIANYQSITIKKESRKIRNRSRRKTIVQVDEEYVRLNIDPLIVLENKKADMDAYMAKI